MEGLRAGGRWLALDEGSIWKRGSEKSSKSSNLINICVEQFGTLQFIDRLAYLSLVTWDSVRRIGIRKAKYILVGKPCVKLECWNAKRSCY
jgi:hypothetical protein